jgi:hypothetical protein
LQQSDVERGHQSAKSGRSRLEPAMYKEKHARDNRDQSSLQRHHVPEIVCQGHIYHRFFNLLRDTSWLITRKCGA